MKHSVHKFTVLTVFVLLSSCLTIKKNNSNTCFFYSILINNIKRNYILNFNNDKYKYLLVKSNCESSVLSEGTFQMRNDTIILLDNIKKRILTTDDLLSSNFLICDTILTISKRKKIFKKINDNIPSGYKYPKHSVLVKAKCPCSFSSSSP